MATHNGNNGIFKAAASGELPAKVGEIISITVTETAETVGNNAMGGKWNTHMEGEGRKGWTANAEMHWDPDDSGQATMRAGTSVDIEYYGTGEQDGFKYSGKATVVSRGKNNSSDNQTVRSTVDLEGNGELLEEPVGV